MRAPVNCAPSSVLTPIRQLHSLRPSHLEVVRAELAPSMPTCTVDGHDDYDGNMMIVVVSNPEIDDSRSYILQASHSGVELAVATERSLETGGTFPTLGEAVERLKQVASITRQSSYVRVA